MGAASCFGGDPSCATSRTCNETVRDGVTACVLYRVQSWMEKSALETRRTCARFGGGGSSSGAWIGGASACAGGAGLALGNAISTGAPTSTDLDCAWSSMGSS